MKHSAILFFFIFWVKLHCVQAQHPLLDTLTNKFNEFRAHTLQEKIYAHIDRTSYLTGEILWFRLYYIDASLHQPLNISKVAYVEILDKNNESVVQSKVALNNGGGTGSLFIPSSLGSGNYIFRVYTHWMKNFSPDLYFHQPITIVNTFVKAEFVKKPAVSSIDAQFFPEGGHAVDGIKTKIAFRGTNEMGNGTSFKGVIVNSKDQVITHFEPLKFGMGHFYLQPEKDESYRAIVEDEKGNRKEYSLETKKTGYVMSLTDKTDHILIDVYATSPETPLVYLFAQTRQMIAKAEGKFLNDKRTQFLINKTDLEEGITHLTLFSHDLKPMCERLFFKQPVRQLNITIESAQITYKPREAVQLFVGANVSSDVSISIHRTDSIPSSMQKNILEYLLLSSDLKGTIESPEYYFTNHDTTAIMMLDNVMLTHGWRRFNWDEVLKTKQSLTFIPEYRGHLIQGEVLQPNGIPAVGATTILSSPSGIFQTYGSRSNAEGEIQFEVSNFFDEQQIFVRAILPSDSTLTIKIKDPFSTKYMPIQLPPLHLSPALKKTLLNRSIAMQTHSIYNQESISKRQVTEIDSAQFYGKPDRTYHLDDYTRFPIMEEVLREYVRGVMVRKQQGKHQLFVTEIPNKPMFKHGALVFLDGVPIFDMKRLLEFNSLKVKKVEVLIQQYYYGVLVFYGGVFLSTYQNDLGGFEVDPKSVSLNYEGLQRQREFYTPRYDIKDSRNSRMPDQRTLLFWDGTKKIDANKSLNVRFYTSDILGEYKVVVEGLSKEGTAGSAVYYFSVTE